jgi:hypothetical protein
VSHAQNITGWQGLLKAGPQKLRIVIKISLEDDKTEGCYLQHRPRGQAIPASAITRDGSTIRMAVAAIGANDEGKTECGRKIDRRDVDPESTVAHESGACHARDRMGDSRTSTPTEADACGGYTSV